MESQDDEISLLDLLLVLVANLRLLVIGPLMAGALAYGGSYLLPNTYQSTALIQGNQQMVSLLTAPVVLDPVIASLKLGKANEPFEVTRQALKQKIKASFNAKDSLVTVTLEARSPESAQQILNELLKSFFEQSKPRGSELDQAQTLLRSTEERLTETALVAQKMQQRLSTNNPTGAADLAQGYATLVPVMDGLEKKKQDLIKTISGMNASQMVQPSTLSQTKTSPKRSLMVGICGAATFFLLLLYVFARSAWQNAIASNSETIEKVAKLKTLWRRALGRT